MKKVFRKVMTIVLSLAMVGSFSIGTFATEQADNSKIISEVQVVDGTDGWTPVTNPVAGQKLSANVIMKDGSTVGTYPLNENIQYMWTYAGSNTVLGTEPVFTVTSDTVVTENTLELRVYGTGEYSGIAVWTAKSEATKDTFQSIEVVDGDDGYTAVTAPKVGQKLTANVVMTDGTKYGSYPVCEELEYKWSYDGSDAVLGTEPTYTVTSDNNGKTLTVTVSAKENGIYEGSIKWTAESEATKDTFQSIEVVDGDDGYTAVTAPKVGQKLTANVVMADGTKYGSYPVCEELEYKWSYDGSDAVLGTEPTYTVTSDNNGKTLTVTVSAKENGIYEGSIKWTAESEATKYAFQSIEVVDGDDGYTAVTAPKVGQKLTANVVMTDGTKYGSYPVCEEFEYKWSYAGSDAVLGTEPTYTVTSDNNGKKLTVTVSAKGNSIYAGNTSWTAGSEVTKHTFQSIEVVDGDDGYTAVTAPKVGQKLTANVVMTDGTKYGSYPVCEELEYKWSYAGSDTVLGTEPTYTVTSDNNGKKLTVAISVKGNSFYAGNISWTAESETTKSAHIASVEVVGEDGITPVEIPELGQKLTANVKASDGTEIGAYPVSSDLNYRWTYEGSDVVLGTDPVFTVTRDNLDKKLQLVVTANENGIYAESEAVWTAKIASKGANKEYLESLITVMNKVDQSLYTEATWNVFNTALADAQKACDNADATQAELDKAYTDLEKAFSALEKIPSKGANKEYLESLITVMNKMDQSLYTGATWNVFKAALTDAQKVCDNADATQEELDKAFADLQKAFSTLEKKVAAKSMSLASTSYTYDGKVKTPAVKVTDVKGKVLKSGTDYSVSYANGRKNVGSYIVKVTLKGDYSGTMTASFKINPKSTYLTSVSKGKKSFVVKWKKQSSKMATSTITGYQIKYSTSSKMTGAKIKTVKGYKYTSKKITKLKAKKKYYVQVRTYKTVSGKNYYSSWSKVKSVKTK